MRYFVLPLDPSELIREIPDTVEAAIEASEFGDNIVSVEQEGELTIVSCTVYYDETGECTLRITQPLEKALDIFRVLLAADAALG